MSENPPSPSPFDGGGAKASFELPPERFAMPDHSRGPESDQPLTPALLAPRDEENVIRVIKVYESSPAYESSTALGDALAKAGLHPTQIEDPEATREVAAEHTSKSDTVEAI